MVRFELPVFGTLALVFGLTGLICGIVGLITSQAFWILIGLGGLWAELF